MNVMRQVNGGPRAGSLSPELDEMDNSTTLPIHLVYARPPSTSADHRHHHQQPPQQFTYSTSRKERYQSTDGVSLVQVYHTLAVALLATRSCSRLGGFWSSKYCIIISWLRGTQGRSSVSYTHLTLPTILRV